MVAQTAFNYLGEPNKKNVLSYLDRMAPEEAANWMDDIKSAKKTASLFTAQFVYLP